MAKIEAKYSPSTGGVYPVNAYSEFPEDALDIPAALYEKFKSGQTGGKIFCVNNDKVIFIEPSFAAENLSVSAAQFHMAIAKDEARYSLVESFINDPSTSLEDKIYWNKALQFKRQAPTVLRIAESTGIDMDELFILAAGIE